MNAETGALLWKAAVGAHNGHDTDSVQALGHWSKLEAPYTYLPGALGGILSNMALARNGVYVMSVDLPFRMKSLSTLLGAPDGPESGEIEALNLSTGHVEWDTKVSGLPLGAATVAGNLWSSPPCSTAHSSRSTERRAPSSTSGSCPPQPTPRSPSPATRCWCPSEHRRPLRRSPAGSLSWWHLPCPSRSGPDRRTRPLGLPGPGGGWNVYLLGVMNRELRAVPLTLLLSARSGGVRTNMTSSPGDSDRPPRPPGPGFPAHRTPQQERQRWASSGSGKRWQKPDGSQGQ